MCLPDVLTKFIVKREKTMNKTGKTTVKDLMVEIVEMEHKHTKLMERVAILESGTVSVCDELPSPKKVQLVDVTTEELCMPNETPPAIVGKVPVDQMGNIPKEWSKIKSNDYGKDGYAYIRTSPVGVEQESGNTIMKIIDKEDARLVDGSIQRVVEYNKRNR